MVPAQPLRVYFFGLVIRLFARVLLVRTTSVRRTPVDSFLDVGRDGNADEGLVFCVLQLAASV